MPIRLLLTATTVLAAASVPAVAGRAVATPMAAGQPCTAAGDASLRAVQTLVEDYVRSGKAPGIVVAIGRGDAPPVFACAGRIADDPAAPVAGPDSLWRIYSMTKPMTAMAVMMLVEDGKIALDQPVSDFIPAFRTMRVLDAPESSLQSHPAQHAITVRHLLTHTSGLAYQIIGKGPLRQEYQRLGLLGGRADAEGSKAQPATLAEFADRLASLPLLAEPGTRWNYSVSLDVLGRVVEVASGMPFERFLETRLLRPLGLASTYWTVPQSRVERLSTNYYWSEDRRIPIDHGARSQWLTPPKVHYGGSGLVSSARDYDRFLQMLAGQGRIGGTRVLKPQTVRLALSNLLPAGVRLAGDGTPSTDRAEGFGAGGWVYLKDVPQGVRTGTFGWFGAAGTIAFIDPRSSLRVTVMTNYFPGDKWPLHSEVVKALYAARAGTS